ncbi:MAG: DUF4145 domain-containing protein [Deltaproteobacteria bacterium]|nr:DUF4145 domain-containing protein [Deltaproteobacteria bacterium]
MKSKYYPPKLNETKFHCAHCNIFSQQIWQPVFINTGGWTESQLKSCICTHCGQRTYWLGQRMVVPDDAPVEPAHPELPADLLKEYAEARSIFTRSPRASAALLRLCLQKLMPHLGEVGKNLNDDIKSLVKKGLPPLIQKSLDFCMVIGNNAVHPGEIDLNDTPDTALQLFGMINIIVEDRIAKPKEIEALYSTLPEDARKAIDERDKTK